MTVEFLLVAPIIGLLAGWMADVVMEGGGYGVIGDVVLGIGGSIAGVWIFRALGFAPNDGWMAIVGAAFVGAVVLIYTQRTVWHKNA
jgi:uncharacterized membrane protein YeaQ/YmgE (transglycosylase-associated protein family)